MMVVVVVVVVVVLLLLPLLLAATAVAAAAELLKEAVSFRVSRNEISGTFDYNVGLEDCARGS